MKRLWICGGALTGLLGLAAWLATRPSFWLVPVLLLAFVPYGCAVATGGERRRVAPALWGIALVTRLFWLLTPLTLSDDAHRYLWEGQIQNAGFNPYRYAPAAPQLEHLRDANWSAINHKEVPTIYPPALLLVLRGAAAVAGSAAVFKVVFLAFDLVTLWVLWRWRGAAALVWAWNPLVIIEFAGSGHEMSLGVLFLVSGLWALESGRARMTAATCFALAGLSHLLALPLVAATRMKTARAWAVFGAVVALGYLLFAEAGRELARGLTHFAGRWRFNGLLFDQLAGLLRDDSAHQVAGQIWLTHLWTKLLVAGGVVGIWLWGWQRQYGPARLALAVGGTMLLFSPVVHPWYLTWLVALCVLELRWTWLVWSGLVLLAYVTKLHELATGVWQEFAWVRWTQYLIVVTVWVWEICRKPFDRGAVTR